MDPFLYPDVIALALLLAMGLKMVVGRRNCNGPLGPRNRWNRFVPDLLGLIILLAVEVIAAILLLPKLKHPGFVTSPMVMLFIAMALRIVARRTQSVEDSKKRDVTSSDPIAYVIIAVLAVVMILLGILVQPELEPDYQPPLQTPM